MIFCISYKDNPQSTLSKIATFIFATFKFLYKVYKDGLEGLKF